MYVNECKKLGSQVRWGGGLPRHSRRVGKVGRPSWMLAKQELRWMLGKQGLRWMLGKQELRLGKQELRRRLGKTAQELREELNQEASKEE